MRPQDGQIATVAFIKLSRMTTGRSRFSNDWWIPENPSDAGSEVIAWQDSDRGMWHRWPEITREIQFPRTSDEIRSELTLLEGNLAALTGEPLTVWDGMNGDLCDTPPGGATLTVEWAVSDRSYCDWYPTIDAAKAALLKLARSENRQPAPNGFYVDLTYPGCHDSRAYVTRLEETLPAKTTAIAANNPRVECEIWEYGADVFLRPEIDGKRPTLLRSPDRGLTWQDSGAFSAWD